MSIVSIEAEVLNESDVTNNIGNKLKSKFAPIIGKVNDLKQVEQIRNLTLDFLTEKCKINTPYKGASIALSIMVATAGIGTYNRIETNHSQTTTSSIVMKKDKKDLNTLKIVSPIPMVQTQPDILTAEKTVKNKKSNLTAYDIDFDKRELNAKLFHNIISAAQKTEYDPAMLLTMAWFESKMDAKVNNKVSSALGLFQFTEGTWIETIYKYGEKHGLNNYVNAITKDDNGKYHVKNKNDLNYILALRNNPKVSAIMAAETMKNNQNFVENKLGQKIQDKDAYLIHVLGAVGAAKFFDNLQKRPSAPVSLLFPVAVKKNPHLFIKKIDDQKKIRSIQEAKSFIGNMVNERLQRYSNMLNIGEKKLLAKIEKAYNETKKAEPSAVKTITTNKAVYKITSDLKIKKTKPSKKGHHKEEHHKETHEAHKAHKM